MTQYVAAIVLHYECDNAGQHFMWTTCTKDEKQDGIRENTRHRLNRPFDLCEIHLICPSNSQRGIKDFSLKVNLLKMALPSSLPSYLFVISVVGYFFGRLALTWIAKGAKNSKSRIRAFPHAGEKGGSSKQEEVAADESFELEKRAFFSRVSFVIQLRCLQSHSIDQMIDLALCVSPEQVQQARRLPHVLLCWHPVLHRPWTGP